MTHKIGIIAEDISDIEVVKILAKKVSGKTISTCHFVGKGCGPLKKKTLGWCKSLMTRGCNQIILLHDRDRNNTQQLRSQLEAILGQAPQPTKIVIIPEEELEAWLLSDTSAITAALKLRSKIKQINHPETVDSPKEFIRDVVYKISEKKIQYVNNVHNKLIAQLANADEIRRKCPSFRPFANFFSPKAAK